MQRLKLQWQSIAFFSYRRDFPPLDNGATSDVGWGCTLRSGQMLLARALQLSLLGSDFRCGSPPAASPCTPLLPGGEEGDAASMVHAHILSLFRDNPDAPFGLHGLLRGSRDAAASAWLAPHALCRVLASAVCRGLAPGQLRVALVGAGGGGAPTLYVDDVADVAEAEAEAEADADAPRVILPAPARRPADGEAEGGWTPLLLLLPLRLGPERTMDGAYLPQLRAALAQPSSCGIVGGRPGSSLYFCGSCGEGGVDLLFLDPHEVVPHANATAEGRREAARTMAASAADPCVAIGFLLRSRAELDALAAAMAAAAAAAAEAPLLLVGSRAAAAGAARENDSAEEEEDESWSFVG